MEVYLFTKEILFEMLIEWQQTIVFEALSVRFPYLFICLFISILHWHLAFGIRTCFVTVVWNKTTQNHSMDRGTHQAARRFSSYVT